MSPKHPTPLDQPEPPKSSTPYTAGETPLMSLKEIRQTLFSMAEEEYKKFSSGLVPDAGAMLGIRLPELRKLAARILKSDWEQFLQENPGEYFEETMLKGFVLARCSLPPEERIQRLRAFLPEIRNWSVCDSVCASVKEAPRHPQAYLPFLRECLASQEEFTLRFGLIMLMDHFLTEEHLPWILEEAASVRHPGYYAKMGAAWVLATCCAKRPKETLHRLQKGGMDEDIRRRAIQKSLESYRVPEDIKQELRQLRETLPKRPALKAPR